MIMDPHYGARSMTALPDGVRQKFIDAERRRGMKLRWTRIAWAVVVGAALIYGVRMIVWAVRLARF